ncbi:hypothetical protein [Paenisporosarcina sp. OV554]|nr:hypothetical protein [Paenisporosarcina sp. OV554]
MSAICTELQKVGIRSERIRRRIDYLSRNSTCCNLGLL